MFPVINKPKTALAGPEEVWRFVLLVNNCVQVGLWIRNATSMMARWIVLALNLTDIQELKSPTIWGSFPRLSRLKSRQSSVVPFFRDILCGRTDVGYLLFYRIHGITGTLVKYKLYHYVGDAMAHFSCVDYKVTFKVGCTLITCL